MLSFVFLPGFCKMELFNRYLKCKAHVRYFSTVKDDEKIYCFLQEVEIHQNEVKLLEANNAKLEAEIR